VQRAGARWLEEVESSRYYLTEIETDHRRITAEIAELNETLNALDLAESNRPEPPELASLRSTVAEAEERLVRHDRAVTTIGTLEEQAAALRGKGEEIRTVGMKADAAAKAAQQRLAQVEAHVADIQNQVTAAFEARKAARPRPNQVEAARSARHDRDARQQNRAAIEWTVLARMARQRTAGFVGSIPLVLDDAFSEWPFEDLGDVLERIRRMSEVIQVVLLTDDVDVARWARDLGRDRAIVIDLTPV
jgi:chromosome segregation ATPase